MNDSRQELKAIQAYLRSIPRFDERCIYYVYMHINTDPMRGDLGCRYIGKGKGKRAWDIGRNYLWDEVFTGNPPEICFVIEDVDEETAFEIERWLILSARAAGVKLCNLSDGYDGACVSGFRLRPETKMKMAETARKRWQDPEFREKMKKVNADPALKAKRSDISKRIMSNPETRAKMATKLRETLNTPEMKEKISIKTKEGWNAPGVKEKRKATDELPETKERRREGQRRANDSPEVRANRSAAQKAARLKPGVAEMYSAALKKAFSTPEFKAKNEKLHRDPERRAKRSSHHESSVG